MWHAAQLYYVILHCVFQSLIFFVLINWFLWKEEAEGRCIVFHRVLAHVNFQKVCASFLIFAVTEVVVTCKIFEELFSFKGMNI